jgi:hypothetical protein
MLRPALRRDRHGMAIFNDAYPVRPGKEDAARAFAKELSGPRLDELAALQRTGAVSRETWTLQETPTGWRILLWFEGDIERTFAHLATADDEFTTWYRAQVLDIAGIDLTDPEEGPQPEVIFEWPA